VENWKFFRDADQKREPCELFALLNNTHLTGGTLKIKKEKKKKEIHPNFAWMHLYTSRKTGEEKIY